MIDLHTHTQFSDGDYNPAEHIRRAQVRGYTVIALTDHADISTIGIIVPAIRKIADETNRSESGIKVLCGVELTHVLPEAIAESVTLARKLGADIVNVHGESTVEPVPPGTNMAAIDAGVDILCHPGLISEEEAEAAAEKGVCLELTSRRGHCYTNGHVYKMAKQAGAALVLNNDAHTESDWISRDMAVKVMLGCGMEPGETEAVFRQSVELARKLFQKS